jgi:hypothetical protein
MSALALRPYQQEAISAVEDALERGIQRPLIVLPTEAPRPTTIRPQQTVAQPRRRAGGCTGTPTARTASSAPDDHDVWVWWHAGPGGTVRTEP